MTILARGRDWAYGEPGDAAALVAEGSSFVGRYVPYIGDQGKGLQIGEAEEYHAHEVDVFLFFEQEGGGPDGGGMADGRPAGKEDANRCLEAAEILEIPEEVAFYFACDWDVQPAQYPVVAAYMVGVNDNLPLARVGFYGHDKICQYIFDRGLATYFCQCRAWSGSPIRVFSGRHLFQATEGQPFNNHWACHEEQYQEDYGQWRANEVKLVDFNNLVLASFSGAEDRYVEPDPRAGQTMTPEERLPIAMARMEARARGEFGSLGDRSESAMTLVEDHKKNHPVGGGGLPTGNVALTGKLTHAP